MTGNEFVCACPVDDWHDLPTHEDQQTHAFVCNVCGGAVVLCCHPWETRHPLAYSAKGRLALQADILGVWPRGDVLACLPSHVGGVRASSTEYRCGGCNLVTNAAALGGHQAASGHGGRTLLYTEGEQAEAELIEQRAVAYIERRKVERTAAEKAAAVEAAERDSKKMDPHGVARLAATVDREVLRDALSALGLHRLAEVKTEDQARALRRAVWGDLL